jgi:cytidine deaminase
MNRDDLLAIARKAALHAYAPYSHFRVGAALIVKTLEGPRIVTGVNVENAAYSVVLCAERAAMATAISLYGNESVGEDGAKNISSQKKPFISHLAVACIDVQPDAPAAARTPCGACRQWLAELASQAVYYVDGIPGSLTIADLLPYAFYLEE